MHTMMTTITSWLAFSMVIDWTTMAYAWLISPFLWYVAITASSIIHVYTGGQDN